MLMMKIISMKYIKITKYYKIKMKNIEDLIKNLKKKNNPRMKEDCLQSCEQNSSAFSKEIKRSSLSTFYGERKKLENYNQLSCHTL